MLAHPTLDHLKALRLDGMAFTGLTRPHWGHGPASVPEPPRNPASRTGDLWILGDHRLLCGDSTSAADVRRLMNAERAILFATAPPYLVDYDGSNHPTRNKDWSASYGTTWDDSSQGAEPYDGFIAAAVAEAIADDAAWYCWHASRRQAMLEACWGEAGPWPRWGRASPPNGRGLRAPADHLGEGPRGSDPLALPLETRALLHGLSVPPAASHTRVLLGTGIIAPDPRPLPARRQGGRTVHQNAPAIIELANTLVKANRLWVQKGA